MSGAPLHVVAGVLQDAQGRVLLARRPAGKADAGLWEFPGGKVEPGESPLDALRRELHEELGLRVLDGVPLICVPVAWTDAGASIRLRLDTWAIRAFEGDPVAHEHDALAWVALDDLGRYPMPPADRPVVAALREPDRLLVTPEPGDGPEAETAWLAAIDAALGTGLRRVHLRLADASKRRRLARELATRCRAAGVGLWVHGDAPLATELGVGLHWRAGQLRDAGAEALTRRHREAGGRVCAAVHDAEELALASGVGVDDLLLGPVKPTTTHPGQPGLGWDTFERLRAQTALPAYALGGVGPEDLGEARRHGAQGVAGIRAFWSPPE
jgi:8-oxo-dGTP diphosphatase